MAEYIERQQLLEKRWDVPFETEGAHFVQVVDVGDILSAPAADVAQVRHGLWVKQDDYSCCSQCGQSISDGCVSWFKYCPTCGAKMDGGEPT